MIILPLEMGNDLIGTARQLAGIAFPVVALWDDARPPGLDQREMHRDCAGNAVPECSVGVFYDS